VKLVWLLLALLLTALTIGGVMSVVGHGDPVELVIVVALGVGAVGCWRRVGAGRRVRGDERRPWER
jgi:hypothetical protein